LAPSEAARRRVAAQGREEAEAARQRRAEAEAERHRRGQQRPGNAPQAVSETPADQAQSNFTEPALPSRQTPNQGWEYGGHAQGSGDGASQSSGAWEVTAASNDQPQAEPRAQATLAPWAQAGRERPTDELGALQSLPATLDKGDYREMAVPELEALGFDPSLAPGRQRPPAPQAPGPETPATAPERRAAKVRTPVGKALSARRKVSGEPVFGQITEARGVRRFLRRGLENLRGEWPLVCLTHNLLTVWRYGRVLRGA
jgi:hypothetical protein